jgi:hypothetical protein
MMGTHWEQENSKNNKTNSEKTQIQRKETPLHNPLHMNHMLM